MSTLHFLNPTELDEIAYLGTDAFFLQQAKSSEALTYDDISLATNYSDILPAQADTATKLHNLLLPTPIIAADMDTVTDARMAIAMAQNGGIGLIHYNLAPEEQIKQVARVKNYVHGVIDNPITVKPDMFIGDIISHREEKGYQFGTFPVVDEGGKLLGLVTSNMLQAMYANRTVQEAMKERKDLKTLTRRELGNNPIARAEQFFGENIGVNKILVIDEENTLSGMITLSDIGRIANETTSSKKTAHDSSHRLLVGAALPIWRKQDGTIDVRTTEDHLTGLIRKGVDAIAISSAHGHTESMGALVEFVRDRCTDITIIAGNVTSAGGVEYLAKKGANAIKVGQGPGSICTTRIVAGVGIPQLSAVWLTSKAAKKTGVQVIADGGITKSGDIVKAFAAGADAVMLGGLLGATNEAPGEVIEIDGKKYKAYRGMGSKEAMAAGSAARYGHSKSTIGKKTAAEGVSALKPASGPVSDTISNLIGGLQSGMGYLGAANLAMMLEKARWIKITGAGATESRPHDVVEIKR